MDKDKKVTGGNKVTEINDNGKSDEQLVVRFRGLSFKLLFEVVDESGEPIGDLPTQPHTLLRGALNKTEGSMKEFIMDSVAKTISHSDMKEFKE